MNTKTILVFAAAALGGTAQAQQTAFQPRMGEPLPELNASQLQAFNNGKAEFDLILQEFQGLGPIFNDTGCSQCHSQPEVGGFATTTVTRFGKKAVGATP